MRLQNANIHLYLQGVIRDGKDLDMLGPEFKRAYAARQIDPFDDQGWDGKHW